MAPNYLVYSICCFFLTQEFFRAVLFSARMTATREEQLARFGQAQKLRRKLNHSGRRRSIISAAVFQG
jgi:hypothetical protein